MAAIPGFVPLSPAEYMLVEESTDERLELIDGGDDTEV